MKEIMKVIPTLELLQEMEELEIYGGENDSTLNATPGCLLVFHGCSVNMVAQCGCQQPPNPPVVHLQLGCGNKG